MLLKFDEIVSSIKQKKLKPIYFLEGEEAYYIDEISNLIETTALTEADRSFNQSILYGKDSTWKQVLDSVKRFPMMSAYQVVILKEAADLKQFELLEPYFQKPLPSTIFVVCHKHKDFDKRKTIGKLVSKADYIAHYKSEPIREWDVENWIKDYVSQKGHKINTKTATLLKEYLGTDLSKIANEISKLFINISKEKEIGNEDVEKYIGISKDYNIFEYQKALATKDSYKAWQFVQYTMANEKANPLVMTIGSLFGFYSKLFIYQHCSGMKENDIAAAIGIYTKYPAKILQEYALASKTYSVKSIEKVFAILHEYDLKSKGVNNTGGNDGALLQELTAKILYA
ncbi:MAG: polymerase subunit delta [Bacteroidota bacterium]|jgi:DNA polymerase-3 subunit delta